MDSKLHRRFSIALRDANNVTLDAAMAVPGVPQRTNVAPERPSLKRGFWMARHAHSTASSGSLRVFVGGGLRKRCSAPGGPISQLGVAERRSLARPGGKPHSS